MDIQVNDILMTNDYTHISQIYSKEVEKINNRMDEYSSNQFVRKRQCMECKPYEIQEYILETYPECSTIVHILPLEGNLYLHKNEIPFIENEIYTYTYSSNMILCNPSSKNVKFILGTNFKKECHLYPILESHPPMHLHKLIRLETTYYHHPNVRICSEKNAFSNNDHYKKIIHSVHLNSYESNYKKRNSIMMCIYQQGFYQFDSNPNTTLYLFVCNGKGILHKLDTDAISLHNHQELLTKLDKPIRITSDTLIWLLCIVYEMPQFISS